MRAIYQLTMWCDLQECRFDFAVSEIRQVCGGYVYLKDRKVHRDMLGRIIPQYSVNKVLLTAFFMPKEVVLQMARNMCQFIAANYKEMEKPARETWKRLMSPGNDSTWFLGNEQADRWEKEFHLPGWEPVTGETTDGSKA